MKWLNYFFPLIKEIKSKEGELHFRRWRIIETPWFNVYVHRIYLADEDDHCHNHPFDFNSFILSGAYWELLTQPKRKMISGWYQNRYVFRKKCDYHKITDIDGPVTTLVITGPRSPSWGYLVEGTHVDHVEYRKSKNSNLS